MKLSENETVVFALLKSGRKPKYIAKIMGESETTVGRYTRRIREKLNVSHDTNLYGLIKHGIENYNL